MSVQEMIAWNCPLADDILTKKCESYCEENDYTYTHMTLSEYKAWKPTEDDLPSLVESIRFWNNLKPKGEKHTWTQLQFKLHCEATKKEKMLLALLEKIPNIMDCVIQKIEADKHLLLKQKLKKKINNARACRK